MTLWKLSMVERELERGLVQLDMKTAIKYFREEHGFEVRGGQQLATNSIDDRLAVVTAWTPESVCRSMLHAVSTVVSSSHH